MSIKDQPAPQPSAHAAVWALVIVDMSSDAVCDTTDTNRDSVIADMQERDRIGEQRYGTRLRSFNGRDALIDAYQEALDMAVYLRQCVEERTGDTEYHEHVWSVYKRALTTVAQIRLLVSSRERVK